MESGSSGMDRAVLHNISIAAPDVPTRRKHHENHIKKPDFIGIGGLFQAHSPGHPRRAG